MKPAACCISIRLRLPGALPFRFATVAWLSLALTAPGLKAQTFDATNLREPTDLAATWLVHAGDDFAYARPDFDDSNWTHFDSRSSLKTVLPISHPEIVWYRLHVKVSPTQTDLALAEWSIDTAFEVFINGERIMRCGKVAPFVPYTGTAQLLERIPGRQVATGTIVIALRVHISPTEWDEAFQGFYATNLTLGQEHALREHIWLTTISSRLFGWIDMFSIAGLGIVALALFAAQRRQLEYLWIFLLSFNNDLYGALSFFRMFHNVPAIWYLADGAFGIADLIFNMLMFSAFLRIRFSRWIQAFLAFAILGWTVGSVGMWRSLGAAWLYITTLPHIILMAGIVPGLLVIHFRRGNREAGFLLIPILLNSLDLYRFVLLGLLGKVPAFAPAAQQVDLMLSSLHVGLFSIQIGNVTGLLFVLSLAIIIILRSIRMSRQQALLEGEVAAAREVQQVILPEQIESVSGFTIESVYQPAQQVGGDFFQILPVGEDGLLVVLGDVAGKGLPAAMLVSVLVGSIRTAAEDTPDPARMLRRLNERMVGRSRGGFSTALAAHFTANGEVTIANAGHLSPYLDGLEIELPGALPLGVVSGAEYETRHFGFAHGSRITFYSDGVVEAQSQAGELFGFDRAKAISTQPAAAIVEAGKQFGQSDDITVVTVERLVAVKEAADSRTATILAPAWESMASEPPA